MAVVVRWRMPLTVMDPPWLVKQHLDSENHVLACQSVGWGWCFCCHCCFNFFRCCYGKGVVRGWHYWSRGKQKSVVQMGTSWNCHKLFPPQSQFLTYQNICDKKEQIHESCWAHRGAWQTLIANQSWCLIHCLKQTQFENLICGKRRPTSHFCLWAKDCLEWTFLDDPFCEVPWIVQTKQCPSKPHSVEFCGFSRQCKKLWMRKSVQNHSKLRQQMMFEVVSLIFCLCQLHFCAQKSKQKRQRMPHKFDKIVHCLSSFVCSLSRKITTTTSSLTKSRIAGPPNGSLTKNFLLQVVTKAEILMQVIGYLCVISALATAASAKYLHTFNENVKCSCFIWCRCFQWFA